MSDTGGQRKGFFKREAEGSSINPVSVSVERGRIRFFAQVLGTADPIHDDVNYARARGHRDIVAPPSFFMVIEALANEITRRRGEPNMLDMIGADFRYLLHGDEHYSYDGLIYAGDEVSVTSRALDSYDKKWAGRWNSSRSSPSSPTPSAACCFVARAPCPTNVPERSDAMTSGIGQSDLEVGDALPEVRFGPITRSTLALYAGASDDHNPAHIDADVARQAGLPDVFAQGMLSFGVLAEVATRWAGTERLRGFGSKFVSVTHVHDVITCRGTLTEFYEENGERRARIAVVATAEDGRQTLTGEAVVALN